MTIKAIRHDGVYEEINLEHVARVWEEGKFTESSGGDFPEGEHSFTQVMFSCGLVVKYKGFIQKEG